MDDGGEVGKGRIFIALGGLFDFILEIADFHGKDIVGYIFIVQVVHNIIIKAINDHLTSFFSS